MWGEINQLGRNNLKLLDKIDSIITALQITPNTINLTAHNSRSTNGKLLFLSNKTHNVNNQICCIVKLMSAYLINLTPTPALKHTLICIYCVVTYLMFPSWTMWIGNQFVPYLLCLFIHFLQSLLTIIADGQLHLRHSFTLSVCNMRLNIFAQPIISAHLPATYPKWVH